MVLTSIEKLKGWGYGDQDLYNLYVDKISKGIVVQIAEFFEFRNNNRDDILSWLEHSSHPCTIYFDEDGFRCRVKFETIAGAVEFKLRWC